MTHEEIEKKFDEDFGGYEWWKSSTRTTFIEVITKLVCTHGLPYPIALDAVKSVNHATAEEYGD